MGEKRVDENASLFYAPKQSYNTSNEMLEAIGSRIHVLTMLENH